MTEPISSDPAAPVQADEPKLSIGQRLTAALASKESLQQAIADRDTTIAEDRAEIDRLKAENADLQSQLTEANEKITDLEAQAAEVEKSLAAAEKEAAEAKAQNTTVEKKAQEKVASLGFPAAKLPAAQEEAGQETAAELLARAEKTTDPKERYKLVKAARDAEAREAIGDN